MHAKWPNGQNYPGDVWHEYGPRAPIWTPNGPTSSFHSGIDIGPWSNTLKTWLLSPVDGEIIHAGYDDIFGNRIVVYARIDGNDVEFWLCHGRTGSMQVKRGDWVSQKQQLQLMGETGKASGVHVHYEVHVNGVRVDPREFYRSGAAAGGAVNVPEEDDMYSEEDRARDNRSHSMLLEIRDYLGARGGHNTKTPDTIGHWVREIRDYLGAGGAKGNPNGATIGHKINELFARFGKS